MKTYEDMRRQVWASFIGNSSAVDRASDMNFVISLSRSKKELAACWNRLCSMMGDEKSSFFHFFLRSGKNGNPHLREPF